MDFFLMQKDSNLRNVFIANELLPAIKIPGNDLIFKNTDGGKFLTLDVLNAQKLQIGQTHASLKQITDSCYAINNTQLNTILPKPTWYDELCDKHKNVKSLAKQWIDNYSITVTSTIPSSIITYAPTFTNCANRVNTILNGGSGN